MKKPLLLLLLCSLLYGAAQAQTLKASFTYQRPDYTPCGGVPVAITFTNTSSRVSGFTSIPDVVSSFGTVPTISSFWEFGDGTKDTTEFNEKPVHTYTAAGSYTVMLIVIDTSGKADTAYQTVVVNEVVVNYSRTAVKDRDCNLSKITFGTNAKTTADDSLSYKWLLFHPDPAFSSRSVLPIINDTFYAPQQGEGAAYLTVTSKYGNVCDVADTFIVTPASPILPANGEAKLTANYQCTDFRGWTNYYFDNNTPGNILDDSLILSLQLNGNDIGTIGDGTFSLTSYATAGAGSNTGVLITNPLISNPSGFWVMNRYWVVTPTRQPATPVGVRFYFTNQDVADVNGSYPSHDLDIRKLIFYKTHGGNPDPTTNLAGAQYITSLTYDPNLADTTHWKDFNDYHINSLDKHVAEFQVSSFSGGGGGATGNGQVLPVQLTSFTATSNGNKVSLQWTTAQEINVAGYNVQVSADGRQFATLGTVAAHGNTMPDAYTFTYNETKLSQAYYRLQIAEKNGTVNGSQVVPLSFSRANNIILYPNPAKNSIQVKAPGFENKRVTADIYNAAGTKVSAASLYFTAGTATLNTSALPGGHYTVALRDEQSVTHLPLVIVK